MPVNGNAPAKVAISIKCIDALINLPKAIQKKTIGFISKFKKDPLYPGIKYETIQGAVDKRYRSVRINKSYRGIVIQPCDKNNVFLLLWVAKHDDAYAWAQRYKCTIHPETGTLEIYDTDGLAFSLRPRRIYKGADLKSQKSTMSRFVASLTRFFKAKPDSPSKIFSKSSDYLFSITPKQMASIGVPFDMRFRVSGLRSVEALETFKGRLPAETFKALYLLATGTEWSKIEADYPDTWLPEIDVDDIGSALERADSKQSFWVIENERELQQRLNDPKDR